MMEFIKSAAPFIVAGAVCIVLIITLWKKRKSGDKAQTYMVEGIALGLCLGAGIGAAIPDFLSYFISLGTLIGFLVGMKIKK